MLPVLLPLLMTAAPGATPAPVVYSVPAPADRRSDMVTTPHGEFAGQIRGDRLVFVAGLADGPFDVRLAPYPGEGYRSGFRFVEEKGKHVDVRYDNRPVLRYVNAPRDGASANAHELSFKPFHHVFDPVKGDTLLTNGPGLAADKANLFPHHRGLFFAFNKISYGDQKDVDVWHGRKNEYVLHEKMLMTEAGSALATHRALLSWHGKDGKPFADEEREVTVYYVSPGNVGTLIDWSTTLTTKLDKVRLDGDPQHAGFHFRAAMEVSKTKANTYYVRPDGVGKPGETRNWEPKGKDPKTVNLPWDACSFLIGSQRYTVLRVPHPDNPKETRGSERDYGRFGDYFEYDLTPATPLKLKYRLWVQPGELTVEQCEKIRQGFVSPPAVTVK